MILLLIIWYVVGVVFGVMGKKAENESGKITVLDLIGALIGGIGGFSMIAYWYMQKGFSFELIYKGSRLQKFMDKELF